jgi:hypothetical protein
MDLLARIKELVMDGHIRFTLKAQLEMDSDYLTPEHVCEAVMNAPAITKTVRSKNPQTGVSEKLYVIKGFTLAGLFVYTKGKIDKLKGHEIFYVFISSKSSTD